MKQLKGSSRMFWLVLGLVFALMLVFNCLTPYVADDYTFSFSYLTGQRLQSPLDVLRSQVHHYFNWSGRFIIKCLAQGFTILPKLVFNLCNAAMFAGLGVLITRLATGRRAAKRPLLLGLVFLALWQFSPVFGQTTLWMCGSVNYLWATVFCLLALLPYGFYLLEPFSSKHWLPFAAFLAALVGGWASENTSAGLLVALVLTVGFVWLTQKRPPLWMWTGLGGALLGFALLVLAPGNYQRQDASPDTRPLLTRLAVRFLTALDMLWQHGLVLLVLFCVLYCLLWLQKPGKAALFWPAALCLAGLGANFAMILSPIYYERSTHGPLTFLVLACAACLAQLKLPALRPALCCLVAALGCVTAFQLMQAGYDIASFAMMRSVREASILEQQAQGQSVIETYAIEPYTRWCAAYGLPDLRESPQDWVCADTAKYYGLEALTAHTAHTYPFPGKTNTALESGRIAY